MEKIGKTVKLKHKYFFNVIEEAVQNEDYYGIRAGRIEISRDDKEYPVDEIRFRLPEKFYSALSEAIDFKETRVDFYLGEINLKKYEGGKNNGRTRMEV